MTADTRITDILSSEYSDFLEFCLNAGKRYKSELTVADFVAFRSQYGIPREQIAELRKLIESYESVGNSAKLINSSDSVVTPLNGIESKSDEADFFDIYLHYTTVMPGVEDAAEGDSIILNDEDMPTEATYLAHTKVVDESQVDTEKDNTAKTDCFSCKSELPLYQIFGVNWELYIDKPILGADFGARVSNNLHAGKKIYSSIVPCISIGDLLQLSPLQLSDYNNLGELSIKRIFATLNQLLNTDNETIEVERTNTSVPISVYCKKQILAMLRDEEYDISNLNDSEKSVFTEYGSASEVIGKEMALDVANGNRAINEVLQMLYDFYKEPLNLYGLKITLEEDAFSLSTEIKRLPVEPFMLAYHISTASEKYELDLTLETSSTVLDFVHFVLGNTENTKAVLNYAISFVKWLHFDIATLCKPMRDCLEKQRDNAQFVFKQRMLGETLEAVGSTMGVTRERIRQIEKKVAQIITHSYDAQKNDHDILATIYALRGGDIVLRYDEIAAQVGDADAQMIWYLAKKDLVNCESYHFSHQSNAVVFGCESEHVALSSLLAELPAFIEKSEMPHYVADLVEKHEVAEELLRMQLRSTYKRDGMFYHRGRLTVVFMCGYILRTRFPNGYKVADESDQQRFLSYISEVFEQKGRMTARALDAKISEVGVLIDRGKYIHPSYIDVDKKIIDDVNTYIENSPRVVLTYTELFDTFSECFSGTQINNRYCLQGVLKLLGCPFVMRKDYVTKGSEQASV